ncbi:MAG TPA: hypothetical protein PKE20_10805 [Promineifilum sp.]|nr:hypothetical protein [Promineifilum sp.]
MRTNQLSWAARLLVVVLVLAACGGGNDTRHPAERVVAGYYIGVARGDTDAVMDAVEPADRNLTGMGLLNLLDALSLSLGPLGIDLGALTEFTFKDLNLELLAESSDYALVRATGNIRYLTLGMEVPFCDTHDVRRGGDGSWYMDINAAERLARLERILPLREAELNALMASGGQSITGVFDVMADSMAIGMNLCE